MTDQTDTPIEGPGNAATGLAQAFHSELAQILDWWIQRMTDQENGGFYGRIDGNGRLHPQAEKGVILNTRILWAFSAAARHPFVLHAERSRSAPSPFTLSVAEAPPLLSTAHRAFHYLKSHFWDEREGGVYWSVDYRGAPLQTKKQVYAQAFAVYALSEYYLLTQNPESLNLAMEIYRLLEQHALDPMANGYFEAYSREWTLLEDLRLSDKDANEAKTQNTHLHVLEAYTTLLHASGAEPVRRSLKNLIRLFLDRFIDPQTGHIHLFFDENWGLKSDTISFGHDIEASWLLCAAAEAVGDPKLSEEVRKVSVLIADTTLREAVDSDGAVINEAYPGRSGLDKDRIWWVQAEAVVGFWKAFQLSGEPKYRKAALDGWAFIREKIIDRAGGEWFWKVSPEGIPSKEEDKAGFWKCPYHNGRMCLEMMGYVVSRKW